MSNKRSEFAYCCFGCGNWVTALKEIHAAGRRRYCPGCAPSDADILPLLLHGMASKIGRNDHGIASQRFHAALKRHLAHGTEEALEDASEDGETAPQDAPSRNSSSGK